MARQDTHRPALRPGYAGNVSAARIMAAFGVGTGPLILLSVLAHDSQKSQQVQQPERPPPDGRDEHVEVRHGQD
jgi:hypothetical protein